MRTTIDIPPGLHQRISACAKERGESFTAVATEALMRGMAPVDASSTTQVSPVTGLLVFDSGRTITSEEVSNLIDEDA